MWSCTITVNRMEDERQKSIIDAPTFYIEAIDAKECVKKVYQMYLPLLKLNDAVYVTVCDVNNNAYKADRRVI